ncbi:putative metal-binding motif-containing protein [Acidobacteria bacterium AH-259-G07]|nr:putative metal-binding motif-containing protein [Acidobacteria bacterium AH-259-G07]
MERKRIGLIFVALCLALAFNLSPVEAAKNCDRDGDNFNDAGRGCGGDDCNDKDSSTFPGAPELCDGKDNNCDGTVDERCDGGGGDGEGDKCVIDFRVVVEDDAMANRVRSDDGSPYIDGVDNVQARTARAGGGFFRFATNRSQKLAGGTRTLLIDFNGIAGRPFDSALKGVDLRFFTGDGGLELCSLSADSGTGTVGLTLAFEVIGKKDDRMTLIYGTPEFLSGPKGPDGPPCGVKVTVTRTDAFNWTISGTQACLLNGGLHFGDTVLSGGNNGGISMPFTMDLTDLNALAP